MPLKKETIVTARLRFCQNDNTHTEGGLVMQFRNGLYSTNVKAKKELLRMHNGKLWDILEDEELPYMVKTKQSSGLKLSDLGKKRDDKNITATDKSEFGVVEISEQEKSGGLSPEDYKLVDEDPDHQSKGIDQEKKRLEFEKKQKLEQEAEKNTVQVDSDRQVDPFCEEARHPKVKQLRGQRVPKVKVERQETPKYERLYNMAKTMGRKQVGEKKPTEKELLKWVKEHF